VDTFFKNYKNAHKLALKLYKQHMEWWHHLANLLELFLAENFDRDTVEVAARVASCCCVVPSLLTTLRCQ